MMDWEILANVELGNKTFNIQPQNHCTLSRQPMPSMSVILTNYSMIWMIFTFPKFGLFLPHKGERMCMIFTFPRRMCIILVHKYETMSEGRDNVDDFHFHQIRGCGWFWSHKYERMWMIFTFPRYGLFSPHTDEIMWLFLYPPQIRGCWWFSPSPYKRMCIIFTFTCGWYSPWPDLDDF